MNRQEILRQLREKIIHGGHCIGVAAGSGMTARYAELGGADFILALSAGKFRQIGVGSFASLLAYSNSNDEVMNFGSRELLPATARIPVIFGFNSTDPTINNFDYIKQIKEKGFSGINNFPTIGLFDGEFRRNLEAEFGYENEVEAIKIAGFFDLFTVAFVFNEKQALSMIDAGADVICIHLGLTVGGNRGAQKAISLESARLNMDRIMKVCEERKRGVIKMIYGGPVSKPEDVRYFYKNPLCNGYIGGSAFERIPVERAIISTTKQFCNADKYEVSDDALRSSHFNGVYVDDIDFIIRFIEEKYMEQFSLNDLAELLHRSTSNLSTKFKKRTGLTFSDYLITQTSHPVLASKSAFNPSKSRNFATSAGKSAKNSTMRA